jgi:hypothetical protein
MTDTLFHKAPRNKPRLEKLGTNDPHCGTCGENDDRTLELHHVAGRKHDGTMVPICRNCHRKVTDDQVDHPPFDPNADPLLASIGHFLLGLADMLTIILPKLSAFGLALIGRSACVEGKSS